MASDEKKKAIESAEKFTKYLMVLAVGALAFELGLPKPQGAHRECFLVLLGLGGLILGLSVFFGIVAHGALIIQLHNDRINLEESFLAWNARAQQILFFLGIVLVGIVGFIEKLF